MGLTGKLLLSFLIFCVVFLSCNAKSMVNGTEIKEENKELNILKDESIGRMIEEGRTMVHHAVKRFMIILPAIFFKLGVAFTMLVLVAIASITNGFIGFLLLVVGLSSVLARLQDSRRPAAIPYYSPLPAYKHQYIHDWDRSDKGLQERLDKNTQAYYSTNSNQQYAYAPLSSYNPSYYSTQKL